MSTQNANANATVATPNFLDSLNDNVANGKDGIRPGWTLAMLVAPDPRVQTGIVHPFARNIGDAGEIVPTAMTTVTLNNVPTPRRTGTYFKFMFIQADDASRYASKNFTTDADGSAAMARFLRQSKMLASEVCVGLNQGKEALDAIIPDKHPYFGVKFWIQIVQKPGKDVKVYNNVVAIRPEAEGPDKSEDRGF